MSAAGVPMVVAAFGAPAPGTSQGAAQESDQVVSILSDTKIAGERNSNPPARAVPEMAAITGFGMLSHSAIALSRNPHCRSRSRPLATGRAQDSAADKRSDGIMTNKITGAPPVRTTTRTLASPANPSSAR